MNPKGRTYLYTLLLSFCAFIITPSVMVLLESESDIAYFFSTAEEEENKEEGKEKEMNENFLFHTLDVDLTTASVPVKVFFHLQLKGYHVYHAPVLPPPRI